MLQKLSLPKVLVYLLCARCYKRTHYIPWATVNLNEVSFIYYPHFKNIKCRQKSNNVSKVR